MQAVKELRVATFHNNSDDSSNPKRSTTLGVCKIKIDSDGGEVSCPMKSGGSVSIKYRVSSIEGIREKIQEYAKFATAEQIGTVR